MAFTIKEPRLLARVGCNHEFLRTLRWDGTLQQGEDWQFGANRQVLFAESAVEKVLAAIQAGATRSSAEDSSALDGPSSKNAPAGSLAGDEGQPHPDDPHQPKSSPSAAQDAARVAAEAQSVTSLTVVSRPGVGGHHYRNPRLVQASVHGGELVMVRTQDSRLYSTGCQIQAYNDGNGWIVAGHRPRRRGR